MYPSALVPTPFPSVLHEAAVMMESTAQPARGVRYTRPRPRRPVVSAMPQSRLANRFPVPGPPAPSYPLLGNACQAEWDQVGCHGHFQYVASFVPCLPACVPRAAIGLTLSARRLVGVTGLFRLVTPPQLQRPSSNIKSPYEWHKSGKCCPDLFQHLSQSSVA